MDEALRDDWGGEHCIYCGAVLDFNDELAEFGQCASCTREIDRNSREALILAYYEHQLRQEPL